MGLVIAVLVVVVGGVGGSHSSGSIASIQQVGGPDQTNSRYPGATVIPASEPKPAITLTDTEGQPYNLQTQTQGRVTLVYFGYTHCPNLCPINMALAAKAISLLPSKDRDRITMVFITTDPDRDTGPVIRAWLDHFDPSFVGLRGTITQIHQAETAVGMPLSYVEGASTGDYQIEHAGYVLAYSQNDVADLEFSDSTSPSDYATSLKHLVSYGYRT